MSRTKSQRLAAQQPIAQTAPIVDAAPKPVKDSYQNFNARIGVGTGNLGDGARYQLNPITRERADLEYMYRGSWIAGIAVDAVADDMTRAGIDFGALPPDEIDTMTGAFESMNLWQDVGDTLRWARLYGGCIGVMLIDGQDMKTPLRPETVGKGAFRGLLVLDRWTIIQTYDKIVQEFGPELGRPELYTVGLNAPALRGQQVHYTRIIRFDGVRLPYQQRLAEQGWGMSVIERMYDRMVAFDSSTQAAAQLIYKAHYRIYAVDGLNQILSAGGPGLEALAKNVEAIRQYQSTEGLTLVDAKNRFETQTYTFGGIADMLLQFAQQISGNLQIPIVRLMGQSPAGLNSTGEGDLRTYYDGIKGQQESKLRSPLARLIDVVYRSEFGRTIQEGFRFEFNPLWQLTDEQKAEVCFKISASVSQQVNDGTISRATALKELKQSSDVTGIFSNIEDDEIKDAEELPPTPPMGSDIDPMTGEPKTPAVPDLEPEETEPDKQPDDTSAATAKVD